MSQQTFTESELKEAGKWFTFIHKNATWGSNITSEQAQEIGRFFNWAHIHMKKIEAHIFELVEHVPAPKEEAPAPAPKSAKAKK